jgi:DNA-binding Lrp family transcriptional regulator
MIVIHYPTAYKALDCFIDAFNETARKSTDKLRTGAVMTAKELIRIYGISLLKANGYQQVDKDNLPTLQTNNRQLAKLVKCSSRTIQRHIHKLQAAGIITSKIFHGSNSNFEVLINPKILLVREKLSVENLKKQLPDTPTPTSQNTPKPGFSKKQKTNCPDTYSCNTGKQNNNLIIAVHNSELSAIEDPGHEKRSSLSLTTVIETGDMTGNRTGDTGEIAQVFSERQKKIEEKIVENTGEIASRVDKSGDRNVPPDPARDNSLNLYTSLLWLMARNLLYKDVDLTERQVLIAKKLIRKLYEPASTANLPNVHQHYIERISLVAKYVRKDPLNRYVPLPYRYFDTNNPKGFVGTRKWYQADQLRKREVEKELVLKRIIRKYQNNEKREPDKKRPAIQLFRECENTIGKFNDASLTERFHAAVLQHETYRQLRLA